MIQICGKIQNITAEREDSGGAVCCRRPTFRAGDRSECGAGAMPSEAEIGLEQDEITGVKQCQDAEDEQSHNVES